MTISKKDKRISKRYRIRKTISGTSEIPRLSVFRSNKDIYVQLIDDLSSNTLVAASSKELTGSKIEQANSVGKLIAEKAIKKGIKKVVFDRGGYIYHGRIKNLADAARESGLIF